MGILSLSCWDFPSPSHGFSAHCRKSTLEEKNPPVRHATLSADNLVCDTRETTSSQGTQEAQVIPEGSEILLPKSSRNSSQSVSALLSDLQRSAQGIFSHLSVKCSITANASQVLSSFFLQPVSSILTSQKGYLHPLWCWATYLQAMWLVQE